MKRRLKKCFIESTQILYKNMSMIKIKSIVLIVYLMAFVASSTNFSKKTHLKSQLKVPTPVPISSLGVNYDAIGNNGLYTDWYTVPQKKFILRFSANGDNGLHIALSPLPQISNPMYEIVLGGWDNTKSVIRTSKQGTQICEAAVGMASPGSTTDYEVGVNEVLKIITIVQNGKLLFQCKHDNFILGAVNLSFAGWNKTINFTKLRIKPTYSSTPSLLNTSSDFSYSALANNGKYEDWLYEIPTVTSTILFTAYASDNIHIALSNEPKVTPNMYEIVLGGWQNTRSVFRIGSQGTIVCNANNGIKSNSPYFELKVDSEKYEITVFQESKVIISCVLPCLKGYLAFAAWDFNIIYKNIKLKP